MGFRFFKRMNILPGVTLNLSKGGGSVSVGPQGAKLTFGTSGARATFGLPGSGLFYTTNFSLKKLGQLFGRSSDAEAKETVIAADQAEGTPAPVEKVRPERKTPAALPQQDKWTPDSLANARLSDDEKELAAGCQALAADNEDEALAHLVQATELADGAFLAGFLSLKKKDVQGAIRYLTAATQQEQELGQRLSRYGIAATMSLEITEEVAAHVGPDIRGVLLALAEAYQAQKKYQEATSCLQRLRMLEPEDIVVKLSLAELLMEVERPTKESYQEVVQLTEGMQNESAVHAALLLYKAKALRGLELLDAALDTLSNALKKRKDRPEDLLRALRYERALVYEEKKDVRKARTELEKLYAEAPDYEDVKMRLEL